MKSFAQLQKEFNDKVQKLQDKCKHKETQWMAHMWAPGHIDGSVNVCKFCNKILERK
jgi:hypothetical protein